MARTQIHLQRRDFLKAATAVAAPYVLTSGALGAPGRPAASKRITTGLIGSGGRGQQIKVNAPSIGRLHGTYGDHGNVVADGVDQLIEGDRLDDDAVSFPLEKREKHRGEVFVGDEDGVAWFEQRGGMGGGHRDRRGDCDPVDGALDDSAERSTGLSDVDVVAACRGLAPLPCVDGIVEGVYSN